LAWGLTLMRRDRKHGIVDNTRNRQHPPGAGARAVQEEKAMIRSLTRLKARNRLRILLALPALAAATAVLAACSSSSTSSTGGGSTSTGTPAAASAGSLKTATIGGATVLTSAKGFTLYSFAPDTSTKSTCNGSCAQNWPPVKGPATASGVTGTVGTIKRSDGSTQVTFDGHPLYTFAGDAAPGQAKGNDLNAFGGLWHEITTSGTAPAGSSSSGSGGGGY
jgi:predicted lipoprotein with Yx(FWY)xxD motif